MNATQRKAINEAIGIEQDWLGRADYERQAAGDTEAMLRNIAYHQKLLVELREDF
jgi:hypothetical protein